MRTSQPHFGTPSMPEMKRVSVDDYANCPAVCEMSSPLNIFIAVFAGSGGFPCNGCGYYKGGSCPAFKFLHQNSKPENMKAPGQDPTETVAAMAARLGISKSEVRRRRAAAAPSPPIVAPKLEPVTLGTLHRDRMAKMEEEVEAESIRMNKT